MSRSPRNFLRHINDEIQYIQTATQNLSKEAFVADETLKRAISRSFEIIGEAVKQLPDEMKQAHPHIPWRPIARMRDRLIHHYFGVDYDIVWDVVENHIEPLFQTVQQLLSEDTD